MDEQHFEYRTGRTQPRKSSSGLITGLLICIIFLCGVISAMGLMNIRLTKLLADTRQEGPPLSFSEGQATMPANVTHTNLMGMCLQELPGVYQHLHELPQGLYVSQVDENSPAANMGIQPGDVLVGINGTNITTLAQVDTLRSRCKSGDQMELQIITREGESATCRMQFS